MIIQYIPSLRQLPNVWFMFTQKQHYVLRINSHCFPQCVLYIYAIANSCLVYGLFSQEQCINTHPLPACVWCFTAFQSSVCVLTHTELVHIANAVKENTWRGHLWAIRCKSLSVYPSWRYAVELHVGAWLEQWLSRCRCRCKYVSFVALCILYTLNTRCCVVKWRVGTCPAMDLKCFHRNAHSSEQLSLCDSLSAALKLISVWLK